MNTERKRGLAYVRGRVASGRYNAADLKRWTKELGPEVDKIVEELVPPKPASTSTGSTNRS